MKKFSAIIITSAILAMALWGALGTSTPAPPALQDAASVEVADAGPQTCLFTPGQTMAFQVENTVVARDDEGRRHPERDRFAAVMSSAVDRVHQDGATLTTAFSDVRLEQHIAPANERIAQPVTDTFTIDIAPDCHILGYHFPEHWSETTRRMVTSVVLARDFALQAGPSWSTEQRDSVGLYQGRYQREGRSILREKRFYDQGDFASFGMELIIASATARATFGASGLDHLQGTERVRILVEGELRADLQQSYRYVRDDAAFRAPAPAARLLAADAFDEQVERRQLPKVSADLETARALFGELTPRLNALHIADAYTLAALVARHPAILRALSALLDEGALDDRARASAFWILEIAATEEARAELVRWLDGVDERDRMRAAVALSGSGEATLETGRLLAALYESDPEPVVASTALMAMGSLAARGDEDVRGFVREQLQNALEAADTTQLQIGTIDAMANAADPSFIEPLRAQINDPDPRVRRHAARAMSHLGDDARTDVMDALANEQDARSAAWMAASLREMGPAMTDELPWAATQLEMGSEGVRAELIRWLGAAKTPEANALLAQQFRAESSTKLRRLIGTFLPASALQGS